MRKADRLFQIIQILRRSRQPVTAAQLAEELEVAPRTVYRDIADLIGQHVPIDGAAGFGYVLDHQYEMPPLMFTPEEIEAALLGAQMVAKLGDVALRNAAKDIIAKIAAVVPKELLPFIAEPTVGLDPRGATEKPVLDTRPLRSAIRDGRKLRLIYHAATGDISERIVWPVLLGYAETHCLLIAWCESRQEFRHFRTERIIEAEVLEAAIGIPKSRLRKQWQQWREIELRSLPAPP